MCVSYPENTKGIQIFDFLHDIPIISHYFPLDGPLNYIHVFPLKHFVGCAISLPAGHSERQVSVRDWDDGDSTSGWIQRRNHEIHWNTILKTNGVQKNIFTNISKKNKKIGSMMFHVKVKYLKREWFVVPLRIPKQSEGRFQSNVSSPSWKSWDIFSTSENFVALHNYVYFLKDYL